MATLYFIVLVCGTLHLAACYSTRDHVTDDVIDPIADHPIIRQLMSRVEYLEKKDRMNSELIGQLRSEMEQCKMDVHDETSTITLDETETDLSGDDHTVDRDTTKSNLTEDRDGDENTHKRKIHSGIRQIDGGQVAFFAKSTTKDLHLGSNQNVLFESVVTNIGNGFNPHHGIFLAPNSGTYVFFSTVLADNNAEVWTHFAVNGKSFANFYARGTDGRHDSGSQMIIVTLEQGDDVSVQSNAADESIYAEGYTTFSGFLLAIAATEIVG